jgi:hypothetical protein
MKLINPNGRSHRSAVIIDGDAYDADTSSSGYRERTKRLLESLNGTQGNSLGQGFSMKADIFVVRGGTVTRCPNGTVEVPVVKETPDRVEAERLVAAEGYTQVITTQAV